MRCRNLHDTLPSPNPHDTSRSNHAVGRMEMRMSEFKGTPGPWKIVKKMGFQGSSGNSEVHDVESLMGIIGSDGSRVLWIGDCTTYYPTAGDEPNHYDARLIEAAPDLLESLVDCIGRFTEAFPAAENYEPIKKARAAIYKAIGEDK